MPKVLPLHKRIFFSLLEKFLATKTWKSIVHMTPRLYGYPAFPLEDYFRIREIIRSNPDEIYCFVGVDNASVSTWVQRLTMSIYWAHSGFVLLDASGEVVIKHVRWRGLLHWPLLKYLKECDEFALLKVPLTAGEKEIVSERLAKLHRSKIIYKIRDNIHLEKQYTDPDFLKESNRFVLYCSEYQYYACMDLTQDKIWQRGRARFTPDDVYRGCDVVWEHRKKSENRDK